MPEHNVTVKVHSQYYLALQATVPLREIIPRVNSEPAGALLVPLCEVFNRGKAQEDRLIQAMVDNPKLIERPIVVANGKARIGRPPEDVLGIV